MDSVTKRPLRIGLALSGGGTRAAVFHFGVLRWLAKAGLIEQVVKISSVSGGSIATALVFSKNNYRWPTSAEYLQNVFPALEKLLTDTDLFSARVVLTTPRQWFNLFNRARMIANLLNQRWGISGKLVDLPETPIWLINSTCVETGKNWRFTRSWMGEASCWSACRST